MNKLPDSPASPASPSFLYWESSEQEVFDYICTKLLAQGRKSIVSPALKAACLYRGPDNLRCAAGHCLPDNLYKPEMEQTTWAAVVREYGLSPKHKDLIVAFQSIHDRTDPKDWLTEMTTLANRLNLNTQALISHESK